MSTNRTPVTLLLTPEVLEYLRAYQKEYDITSVSEAILTVVYTHLGMGEKPIPPFSTTPCIYDGVEDGPCEVLNEYLDG